MIKVLNAHLFYNKKIEVEKYKNDFYIVKKMNYDEEVILDKYLDKDNLIGFSFLKEDLYVSTPYKRVYELDGYWFFVPKILTNIVEYLYENDLAKNSKIKITKTHTVHSSRAPIINVNYDAKQIEDVTDKWELENNITEETYEKLSKEHFRSKSSK